jgi:GNAT superfamily N-acetyltransferase
MLLRPATRLDIPSMHAIRVAVKENVLSDPALITPAAYQDFMENRGAGWVVADADKILGFAIVDLEAHNVWALFVHPDAEKKGVGRQLHDAMIRWYFSQTTETLWLGTEPNSRAAGFYRKAGWTEVGKHGSNEIRFEFYASNVIRT